MQPSCQRCGHADRYHRIRDCKVYAVTWTRCMQPAVCVVLRVFQLIEGFYISWQKSAGKKTSQFMFHFCFCLLTSPHTLRSNARLSAFLSQRSRGTWHPHMVTWPDIAASGARHIREMFATNRMLKTSRVASLFFFSSKKLDGTLAAQ